MTRALKKRLQSAQDTICIREGQLEKIDETSQGVCLERRSRRLWFDTSARFTEPETRQRVKQGNGEKRKTRKGVRTSGSHNASMRAILRTCCPVRQDVKMQKWATLVRPGDFREGQSQRERCLVKRENNLSYCLPERSSGLGSQPCHWPLADYWLGPWGHRVTQAVPDLPSQSPGWVSHPKTKHLMLTALWMHK